MNRPEAFDPDRGSLIIAVAIILILGLLGMVICARAVGAAFLSTSHQQAAAAVSQADAGLADALFRIDQGAAGTGGGSAFCVGGGRSACLAGSVPAAPGVTYVATQVSSTDWRIDSEATVEGRTAAVEGHVTRPPQYPFGLFGKTSLELNGTSSPAFSSYTPSSPAGTSPANPDPNGDVAVGTNGTLTCNGVLGPHVTVTYYGSGGVGSTGTSDCGTYKKSPNRYYVSTPVAPDGALPCPGTGVSGSELGSGYPGAPTLLAAGAYVCDTPIALSGRLDVGGPVQLYVMLGGASGPAVTVSPGSYINDDADYCATNSCAGVPEPPASQDLEIFSDSTGTIGNVDGAGYYLGAVVYAPGASLTWDACKSHYYGSLVINALTCPGGPDIHVSYDTSLATVYGPWTAGAYTQINPATFTAAMSASGL